MFRIIIISIAAIIGLAGCGDDAAQKSVSEGSMAVKVSPVAAKNEMNTQDVKKNDVQAVAIQSQTVEASQSVAQALVKEQKKPAVEQIKPLNPVKKERIIEVAKEKVLTKPVITKKTEAPAAKVATVKSVAEPVPVSLPKQEVSLGDVVKGKKLAKRCVSCHDFGMKDKVGPHLKGVFNRVAGQSGFKKHGAALKTANWTWDEAHLLKWLCDSKAAIKEFTGDASAKTKMPKQKMCGAKGNDIVAYLKTI
jgi:cytochrome c